MLLLLLFLVFLLLLLLFLVFLLLFLLLLLLMLLLLSLLMLMFFLLMLLELFLHLVVKELYEHVHGALVLRGGMLFNLLVLKGQCLLAQGAGGLPVNMIPLQQKHEIIILL